MKELVEVLKLVEEDKQISAEIDKDIVRLYIKDVDDVIEIREIEGKLNILVLPCHHKEEVDFARLEEIIKLLKKQANYKHRTYEEIQQIKKTYPRDTKIKLIKMYDLQAPKKEMILTVNRVDDAGTIYTKELGLGIVVDVDEFVVLGGDIGD